MRIGRILNLSLHICLVSHLPLRRTAGVGAARPSVLNGYPGVGADFIKISPTFKGLITLMVKFYPVLTNLLLCPHTCGTPSWRGHRGRMFLVFLPSSRPAQKISATPLPAIYTKSLSMRVKCKYNIVNLNFWIFVPTFIASIIPIALHLHPDFWWKFHKVRAQMVENNTRVVILSGEHPIFPSMIIGIGFVNQRKIMESSKDTPCHTWFWGLLLKFQNILFPDLSSVEFGLDV